MISDKSDVFYKITADYEALWIKIHNTQSLNILCGIIYRHPNGNLESFFEY